MYASYKRGNQQTISLLLLFIYFVIIMYFWSNLSEQINLSCLPKKSVFNHVLLFTLAYNVCGVVYFSMQEEV